MVKQAAKQRQALNNEDAVNKMLAVDLSAGFIWAELNDQVSRWIQRINEYGITKWVLYLSVLEEGERIEPEHIRQRLLEKEALWRHAGGRAAVARTPRAPIWMR